MRILLAVVAVLATLWSGYWFIGSTAKKTVINAWFDDRQSVGWTAEYSSFKVVGFPNRFDSRFIDLKLADPVAGWSWDAPLFNILALSYQPNHIIAVWPHSQVIGLPLENITVTSSEMIASVVFEPDTKLALDRTTLQVTDLALTGDRGWQTSADSILFSTRQSTGKDFAHDIVFEAENLTPTQGFKDSLDPSRTLPTAITRLLVDIEVVYDAPWDRIAVESGLPFAKTITLKNVSASWGPLNLLARGKLDIEPTGYVRGKVSLKIKNWRGVLALGVSSGFFNQALSNRLESGLGLLTALTSDPRSLNVPLTFANGQMSLGPIPLGVAPRFNTR